ncbi:MAG: hypothetical protein I3275_07320, partial [Candidatus Moeniiplasma glomeromycotorum]|nr:hypothetical protein [Candidatus Moeniiplasma glomeromycotorum]
CIANGYYKPNSPPDLALLKERRNKVNKLFSNKEERAKLLAYADSEDYEIVSNLSSYFDQMKEIITGEKDEDADVPQVIVPFAEDWIGRAEKLIRKKEEAEKSPKKKKKLLRWFFHSPTFLRI